MYVRQDSVHQHVQSRHAPPPPPPQHAQQHGTPPQHAQQQSVQPVVFYARQCTACSRFLEAARRANVPLRTVDVMQIPAAQRSGFKAVPTLMLPSGQSLVGTKAFEWLSRFEGPSELDPARPSGRLASSLTWCSLAHDGQAEGGVVETYAPLTYGK